MNYISVYRNETDSVIKLSFNFNNREYNLTRKADDTIGQTLKRISLSVQKAELKSRKQESEGTQVNNDAVNVQMFSKNGENLLEEMVNSEAWCDGNMLQIRDTMFVIELDTPLVVSVVIPSVLLCGYPIVPMVKLEFAEPSKTLYEWLKQSTKDSWVMVSQDYMYTPTVEDIGCVLKLRCKAVGIGKEAHTWYTVIASESVSASPGFTPFMARQVYTKSPITEPNTIRIMSYNILADCYLEDEATCEAWFGYCPKYALKPDYRQQILLKEILGYNSDIICLQECGRRMYQYCLSPVMTMNGYAGSVIYKNGVMMEGEAIFYRKTKFKLISQHEIIVKDSLMNDPINKHLLSSVQEIPRVFQKISSRTTVVQCLLLQYLAEADKYLVVVNTHLYFKPDAPYIRNIQCSTILNHVKEKMNIAEKQLQNISVIFCGDFNSLPDTVLVKFMCGTEIQSCHPDWIIPPTSNEEQFTSLNMPTLYNPFSFQNCCGIPEFTTYTEGFKGVLDYIFASKEKFNVKSVVPFPSAEDLGVYTAIPSPVMSSDHIALICDMEWV